MLVLRDDDDDNMMIMTLILIKSLVSIDIDIDLGSSVTKFKQNSISKYPRKAAVGADADRC